jgi:hypothetical protein
MPLTCTCPNSPERLRNNPRSLGRFPLGRKLLYPARAQSGQPAWPFKSLPVLPLIQLNPALV